MSNGIWLLGQQKNGKVEKVTFELIARAEKLAQKNAAEISVMLFGHDPDKSDLQKIINCGVKRVVYVDHRSLANFLVEPYAACMVDIIDKYKPEILLGSATSMGRTLMPYVAIKVNAGLTADCTELNIDEKTGNLLQTRPAIGGNIMATIETPDHRPQMATVRPHSNKPATGKGDLKGEIIITTPQQLAQSRIMFKEFRPNVDKISLADADCVLAVGRGIKKKENLGMILELAEKIDAAVGATRDVVDMGWLDYSHQIGLSGQTVSPKLYIGIGLSGSIQHIAGIQTSENIIAINKDRDAQIFKVADFGIVGDLFEIIPEMIKRSKNGKPLWI